MASTELDAMIAKVRSLGNLNAEIAREAAPLVERAAKATVAAGTDPSGKPWPPKKDGGRPLVNAAKAVTATAKGSAVEIAVKGIETYHHLGTEDGVPRRQMIPMPGDPIPKPIATALKAAAETVFRRNAGGA